MKRKILITLLLLTALIGFLYYYFIFNDVVVYISNYSRNAEKVHCQIWLNAEKVIDDNLQHDLTASNRSTFRFRGGKQVNTLLVKVDYGDVSKQSTSSFEIEDIEFVVVTVDDDSQKSGQLQVAINNFNFREARDMNLIFHKRQ